MQNRWVAFAAVLTGVAVIGAGTVAVERLTAIGAAAPFQMTCPSTASVKVGEIVVPSGPVAGFCQDRLINAAHIMNAARAQGIGTHTQAIGVMTAIGESRLRVLDHGDSAGPDSRGLFQQRANGAWGSLSDRMNPYISASNFFTALVNLPRWKTLTPSEAAHDVQGNADPNYYQSYWPAAQTIVKTLNQ